MQQTNKQEKEEAVLQIVYYTDPLCCWSWAFEPQWLRFRLEFAPFIKWRYCMGGLISSWETFNDPMNAISKPVQMGPLWFEAKHISGMPVNDHIWLNDPPASSYPACIAVKCAGLQSADVAEQYLRKLREAVMLKGQNIAKKTVLMEVAETLATHKPALLNMEQFEHDLQNGAGQQAFRKDIQEVSYQKISRFPTLTITTNEGKGVIIVGYRPYKVLLEAIAVIAPELKPVQTNFFSESNISYWETITARETEELKQSTEAPVHL